MEVKLPDLSAGVINVTITMWHYGEGDTVRQEDDLVEFVTDKAAFTLPSPITGKVKKIMFAEGEIVSAGETIAVIE